MITSAWCWAAEQGERIVLPGAGQCRFHGKALLKTLVSSRWKNCSGLPRPEGGYWTPFFVLRTDQELLQGLEQICSGSCGPNDLMGPGYTTECNARYTELMNKYVSIDLVQNAERNYKCEDPFPANAGVTYSGPSPAELAQILAQPLEN